MLQEYLGEDKGEFEFGLKNPDGSYQYPYFDLYFKEATRFAYFIEHNSEFVGFAMVRGITDEYYTIAEFYVVPEKRRSGLGRAVMNVLFAEFPKRKWLISVILQNEDAVKFWLNIAGGCTEQIELEIIEKRRFNWVR